MKKAIYCLLSIACLLFLSNKVNACPCFIFSDEDLIEHYEYILLATIDDISYIDGVYDRLFLKDVEVLKGGSIEGVKMVGRSKYLSETNPGVLEEFCSVPVVENETYLLVGQKEDDGSVYLIRGLCAGFEVTDDTQERVDSIRSLIAKYNTINIIIYASIACGAVGVIFVFVVLGKRYLVGKGNA